MELVKGEGEIDPSHRFKLNKAFEPCSPGMVDFEKIVNAEIEIYRIEIFFNIEIGFHRIGF